MWKVLKCRKKVGGRKYAEIMQIALCFETVENLKNIYSFNDTIFDHELDTNLYKKLFKT